MYQYRGLLLRLLTIECAIKKFDEEFYGVALSDLLSLGSPFTPLLVAGCRWFALFSTFLLWGRSHNR